MITLTIVSKPVLSHFSSTVFALSCVSADVSGSFGDSGVLSSCDLKREVQSQIIIFIGLRVNQVVFPFIIFELALLECPCQSSSIGLRSICITDDSSSSSLENALVILLIGSDSSLVYVLNGKKNSFSALR